ncbi:hypothetical protein [Poseidonibacter antarcticus]|uniref:hypothetical protein n=1 Tax=Poseidonibacter antarcticus TaxID=2478538 RepID=UPI000EF45184|nr:hypothetical protein [Poseidonibacter antarcticus]
MKKLKYLNHIVLLTSLTIGYSACGDTKKVNDQKVKQSETLSQNNTNIEPFIKKYAIKSAHIEYKIIGSMDIMGNSSKTTGTKKLIFSNFGSHELTEINKIEEQNMMGNQKTIKTHTLDYIKEATLYKVDFNKKNIQRMQVPALGMMIEDKDESIQEKGQKIIISMGGKKIGIDKVLGYECEVWSLMGTEQCLYKGIPLKVQSNIMGIKNTEIATKIEFDLPINKDIYKLPTFPIIDSISGTNIDRDQLDKMDETDKKNAIKNRTDLDNLTQTLQESQKKIKANPNMSEEEQKRLLIETMSNSKDMKSQFEKQKEMMPKAITLMKFYRDCLQDAKSKADAQSCDKRGQALAKKLGIDEEFNDEEEDKRAWTKEGRRTIVLEINEEIKNIESRLPCIQKAKNMMDLMNCNQ